MLTIKYTKSTLPDKRLHTVGPIFSKWRAFTRSLKLILVDALNIFIINLLEREKRITNDRIFHSLAFIG